MRLLAILFSLVSGSAFASPGYHLQMELGLGKAQPEALSMTVAEGVTGSLTKNAEVGGFSLEVTVTPAEPNAKTGLDQVNVQVRIFDQVKGKTVLRGEPTMKVGLGKISTIQVGAGDDAASDQGFFFKVTVSRTQSDVLAGNFTQCSSAFAGAGDAGSKLASQAKACGENCCCYSCPGNPPQPVQCCNACCNLCGSGCCAQ